MSSTPTPIPAAPKPETTPFGVLLNTHHLILYGVIFLLSLFAIYGYESHKADLSKAAADAAHVQLAIEQKQNTDFQAQVLQKIADLKTANDALAAQNAQLAQQNALYQQQINARDAALLVQQKKDAALPPDQLAAKISTQVGVPAGVTPTKDGNYAMTAAAAGATIQALDEIPVLTQDKAQLIGTIANLNQSVLNLTQANANNEQALKLEQDAHAKDKATDKIALDTAAKDLQSAKDSARKGKMKWFGIGFVLGYLTGAGQHLIPGA